MQIVHGEVVHGTTRSFPLACRPPGRGCPESQHPEIETMAGTILDVAGTISAWGPAPWA